MTRDRSHRDRRGADRGWLSHIVICATRSLRDPRFGELATPRRSRVTPGAGSSSDLDVRGLIAVATAVMLATGCSVIAVRGPQRSPTGQVECKTPSYAPPVIDAAIALAGVALIVWSATAPGSTAEDHALTGRDFADYPGFAMALPFSLSAIYGFTTVAGCKRAARESRAQVGRASIDP